MPKITPPAAAPAKALPTPVIPWASPWLNNPSTRAGKVRPFGMRRDFTSHQAAQPTRMSSAASCNGCSGSISLIFWKRARGRPQQQRQQGGNEAVLYGYLTDSADTRWSMFHRLQRSEAGPAVKRILQTVDSARERWRSGSRCCQYCRPEAST